jgi:NADPH:quinone reductase-like Zn-dependent oxidoreductase
VSVSDDRAFHGQLKKTKGLSVKSVRFGKYGGPEVMEVLDVGEPHPGPGQVRIAVRAAGVNAIDWKTRSGQMQEAMPLELPAGLGQDAAGVVDEVGEGVTDVLAGDPIFGSGDNAYSQYAVLKAWAAMPETLSFDEAAGYPTPVETAVRILDQVGARPCMPLLVNGASGGVGTAVLQLAREREIPVIGVAGEASQQYIQDYGAAATTYGPGIVDRVRELAPDGIHTALDLAGSGVIQELIELTGDPNKVLSIADFNAPDYGAQVSAQPGDRREAFTDAARLFAAGKFGIPTEHQYPLERVIDAHTQSEKGHARGRIVLTVA